MGVISRWGRIAPRGRRRIGLRLRGRRDGRRNAQIVPDTISPSLYTGAMAKIYDPPLTGDGHSPLYRVDKAIKLAQQRLDAAIDAKRHHTSQNLAQEVIKEAREALRKADQQRALKLLELKQQQARD